MRKMLLLVLLALCLSACGAPGAGEGPAPTPAETPVVAETPAPTPVPTPEPALSLLPDAGPLPDYIPPMGFEPVSVWEAEPFGDGGQALLYMGEETDGVTPFKVFSSYRYCWTGTEQVRTTDCRSFSGTFVEDDGKYSFTGKFKSDVSARYNVYLEEEACLSSLSGSADIDGGLLTLQYSGSSPYNDSVTVYESFDECPYVICTFNGADFSITEYLPSRFTALPEDQLGYAMYQMPAFVEETDTGKYFRGLKNGDNISDILARIPVDPDVDVDGLSTEGSTGIYGAGEMNMFGSSLARDARGSLQLLISAFDIITYTLDESFNITNIDVFRQTYYLN